MAGRTSEKIMEVGIESKSVVDHGALFQRSVAGDGIDQIDPFRKIVRHNQAEQKGSIGRVFPIRSTQSLEVL